MKIKLSAFILICVTATVANAGGVQEKKAQRAANEAIAAAADSMKAACGNQSLEASVAWDKVDAMAAANAALIESNNSKLEFMYSEVSERTTASIEALSNICSKDADYKEEIANLTKIIVVPKDKYDDYRSEFSLTDTTLTISNGWYMSRSASDFEDRLKALY